MSRLQPLAVALAAVALMSTASSTASAAIAEPFGPTRSAAPFRASARLFDVFHDGVFGCRITINARNEGSTNVIIKLSESRSRVKISPSPVPGTWNRWSNESDWTVNPGGASESKVVELSMACNPGKRGYEFIVARSGNEKLVKWPADGDFSDDTTIPLGNVARHF
jgi:hypothetical protein